MKELQEKLNNLKINLDKEQQKLLSLNSIQNFLCYYNKLTFYKEDVQKLLIQYFVIMENSNYEIDKETSTQIGIDYIMKIGYYYSGQLGFKMKMNLDFAIFWGLIVDSLLLLVGVIKIVYYLPITTILIILYWAYLKVFYETKNKVFAVRY